MGDEDGAGIFFTRMYASADGESHFEDVTVETTAVTVGPGLPGGAKGPPAAVTDLARTVPRPSPCSEIGR